MIEDSRKNGLFKETLNKNQIYQSKEKDLNQWITQKITLKKSE